MYQTYGVRPVKDLERIAKERRLKLPVLHFTGVQHHTTNS